MIIIPNDSLHITINDPEEVFEFKGKSAEAQNLYNSLEISWIRTNGFPVWLKTPPNQVLDRLSDTINEIIVPFSRLLEEGSIQQGF